MRNLIFRQNDVVLPRFSKNPPNRGFALISALLILLIITVLGIGMYKGFGTQEKIAGNTLEKQRSLQAAESVLQYGEWWLGQGSLPSPAACNSVYDANTVSNIKLCSNALTFSTASTLPWTHYGEYVPSNMTVLNGGGLVGSGGTGNSGDVNYSDKPKLYVAVLGAGPDGNTIYQVTGLGYGGSDSAASVVQSTYASAPSPAPSLSGP